MPHIEVVWQRVVAHQGEDFHQIRGKEFIDFNPEYN